MGKTKYYQDNRNSTIELKYSWDEKYFLVHTGGKRMWLCNHTVSNTSSSPRMQSKIIENLWEIMTNMKDGEWKPENYTHCQRTIIQRKNKDTD